MRTLRPVGIGPIVDEYLDSELGDARLDGRLRRLASKLGEAPARSFPELFRDPSQLEATYRFFANDTVLYSDILEPHVQAMLVRAARYDTVRIVHDTTTFSYDGEREGLRTVSNGKPGFLGHFALAVTADEERVPLGVMGLRPLVHQHAELRRTQSLAKTTWLRRRTPRAAKESGRWESLAIETQGRLPEGIDAIHIMDQEADDYLLFAALLEAELRFIVRGWSGRLLADKSATVAEAMTKQQGQLLRTVRISTRSKKASTRQRAPRVERMAELHARWNALELKRPSTAETEVQVVPVWVVNVFEPNPPEGEEPIEWTLFTSEPITTLDDAATVIDHYRARWVIEEYFKALKTGCSVEKRQLTTYAGLLRAVAVFAPIAWHLLALRTLARLQGAVPAAMLFKPEQLELLAALLNEHRCAVRLGPKPTARDAMLAIASLGGHLPRNGEPGWLVLGRGYEDFLASEKAWLLARTMSSTK